MTFTTRKAVSKAVWDLKYMVDMASKRKLIGLSVCLSVSVCCLSVSSGCPYIYPSIHLSVSLRALTQKENRLKSRYKMFIILNRYFTGVSACTAVVDACLCARSKLVKH